MNLSDYPIFEKKEEILKSIQSQKITILEAPTGSGKTTCLPLFFLDHNDLKGKKILILEPRRIAAKNAASRLSFINGTEIGETIGYRIRFESKVSQITRIELVTDGILTKLLLADPELKDYGLIIFDEFHERSMDSDFCLALVRSVQTHFRKDLKILIMSATLEGINFGKSNFPTSFLKSDGKSFPVDIFYQGESEKRQSKRLADLVPKVLEQYDGDILIFFAGVSEINETYSELTFILKNNQVKLHKLYGEMNFEEQQEVFRSHNETQRKVILATNLAESSITLPNVKVVLDTGYCKRAIFDPESGLTRLVKKRISLASAKQRAGRAGRTSPGVCYRLWSKEEETNFVNTFPPEILEADFSNFILISKIWGEEISALPLLDLPSEGTISEQSQLLVLLGCLDEKGNLTSLGKKAALLPIPLRLAVMCLVMIGSNELNFVIDLATVFSERNLIADSFQMLDFQSIWDKWLKLENLNRYPKLKLVREQVQKQLQSIPVEKNKFQLDKDIGLCLSLAFPDRIAKIRNLGTPRYKMRNGKGVFFAESTSAKLPEWILVLDTDGNTTEAKIKLYCELKETTVLKLYQNQIQKEASISIDTSDKRSPILRSFEEHKLGEINIKRVPLVGISTIEDKKKIIFDFFSKNGIRQYLFQSDPISQFFYRVQMLNQTGILKTDLSDSFLLNELDTWYFPFLNLEKDSLSIAQFENFDPLLNLFTYQEKELIHREAPTHLTVPSGSKIKVEYSEDKVFLSAKLQELFGWEKTPTVASGKISVTLMLLSPAGRPVQVTQDLRHFWNSTYHEVKKELKGRYPKHPWPDSPWEAIATKGTKKNQTNRS